MSNEYCSTVIFLVTYLVEIITLYIHSKSNVRAVMTNKPRSVSHMEGFLIGLVKSLKF